MNFKWFFHLFKGFLSRVLSSSCLGSIESIVKEQKGNANQCLCLPSLGSHSQMNAVCCQQQCIVRPFSCRGQRERLLGCQRYYSSFVPVIAKCINSNKANKISCSLLVIRLWVIQKECPWQ